MAKIIVTYKRPVDLDVFMQHYTTIHAPLARQLPGLRSYEISDGPVMGPAGVSEVFMAAVMCFDSVGAIQAALGSPAGQAALADLPNFAAAGVDMLMFETKTL